MAAIAAAVVVDDPGLDPGERLAVALRSSGAWEALEKIRRVTALEPGEVPILIIPDLGGFETGSPAATDPALVEILIDQLHDAGYSNVVVGASADTSSLWAANRDVFALADLLGYRFATPGERAYDIVDLSDDLGEAGFRPGDVLFESQLSRAWTDAGFRIVFAKNKSDERDGYSLGLSTVLGALPLVDKDYHYRLATPPGDVVAELLRVTPVHLCLIDGITSCHGSGGGRAPRAITTDCLIASRNIWLADTVGAIKMGLDPGVSPLTGRAPTPSVEGAGPIAGSLATYEGWIAPGALVLDSTSRRDSSPLWSRLVPPWLQVLDPEIFPLESPLDARMNERLAHLLTEIDEDPVAFAALVFANYTLGGVQQALDGYRVLFDKDRLRRSEVPLGFDPVEFGPEDYTSVVSEMLALERLIDGAPEFGAGLRWRYLDEAVLFEYRRALPIDFDTFVASVDVALTIQYMNDYIGGVVVPVEFDAADRVVRQAERNLYLPQPNYLVLSDGKPIDVGKLEVVEYEADAHRMYWKTIRSENDSATHDDGMVTFARTDDGTAVTIVGRQLFTLPPFWQAMQLGLNPELKRDLVTEAYATFFDRTLANFEAIVEGRDIRIGRPWHVPDSTTSIEPLPAAALEQLVEDAFDWLQTRTANIGRSTDDGKDVTEAAMVDADGFSHFRATSPVPSDIGVPARSPLDTGVTEFWSGLFDAALRDVRGLAVVSGT